MCENCGCEHEHNHNHEHDHKHNHKRIELSNNILDNNNFLAQRIRGYLEAKNILALNIMSSPGSGKTTILEKTIDSLKHKMMLYVIEGDQQTQNDAERIRAKGINAEQINTGGGCHLDANSVYNSLKKMNPKNDSILFIENVGNLVCPALFDLGQELKVVIISVTEGDDKPLKYPQMFYEADICIINKIDLLPYLDSDIETLKTNLLKTNHHLKIFEISATKNTGIDSWCDFILKKSKNNQLPNIQQSFFDEKAFTWDNNRNENISVINNFLDKLSIIENDSILDVGSGTGVLIPYLVKKCDKCTITAADYSSKMIEVAKNKFKNYNNIIYKHIDIERESLDDKYNKIILFCVYPHFENQIETIKKLYFNNLNKDGKMIIAFDRSREFLNKLHFHSDDRIKHSHLLDVEAQKQRFIIENINVIDAQEDENSYFILLEKNK